MEWGSVLRIYTQMKMSQGWKHPDDQDEKLPGHRVTTSILFRDPRDDCRARQRV